MLTIIAPEPAHGVMIPDGMVSPRSLGNVFVCRPVTADQSWTQTVVRFGAQLNIQAEPLRVMLTQP